MLVGCERRDTDAPRNPAIASALATTITPGPEVLTMPVPPFCADAKAWAQSGFRALSSTAGTRFEVSSESSSLFGRSRSCHQGIAVSYSRPGVPELLMMGGPPGPWCLP